MDTEYEVQVRATNDEGTSGWSDPGSASTDANAAPAFTSSATFSAAENQTAAGTVEASDSDTGDSVTGYAIQGGADRSKFSIGAASGVLTFRSAPNFEDATDADASNTYVVVVRATSGTGARAKTADQTITVTVTDVDGEAPGVPAAPTVSSASVSSVTAAWAAPANAGPPITDYDYRYQVKSTAPGWTEVTNTTSTALSATITGLAEDTEYEVQVRATNDEGTSGWSDPGSASTDANAAPAFTSSATFDAAENQTAAGTVEASDSDTGDSVTGYAIQGGADRSKFSIGAASGVLTFRSAPNFEDATDDDASNTYVVVVRATSGTGARAKTADQTITVTVTDVDDEAPGVPAAPTVSSASVSSLTAAWAAPANAGPPITDYDYRYRVKSTPGWTEVTNTTITALSATITGLADGTEYEVQVRATNDEGTSGWSDPGSASPDANAAPAFTSSATFSAAENQTAAGTVEASDSDTGDSVTGYAIQGGADRSKFSIGAASGVLTFRSAPNFEDATDADASNTYVVVVRATSGTGARAKTADQTITVTVTDVDGEAPGVPAAPTVSSASVSSVTAAWAAPANAGPPITDYDYRYQVKSTAPGWTEVTNTTSTALSATITGLAEDTEYEVQVRATNDEGTSGWSDSGSASTDANAAPAFTSSATFDAAENQTAAGTVAASDSDTGDSVTGYAIQGGADQAAFSIGAASGVLTFRSAPNFEDATDADASNTYVVVVRATSGTGARAKTADQTITVTVTDVDDEAPGVPAAPTVSSASVSSLTAAWAAPANAGPPITDYDYRYRVKSTPGWTEVTNTTITALSATITGLADGHGVRGAGAGDQRRGHERLVRPGQRLAGRERGAGVHLVGDVQRGGEPDRGGDGRGVGQRHGRQRDGLCDPGRRGQIKVLDRGRERGADVQVGAELRGRDGRRRQQHVRGGGAGDQRHGRAGEDGGPDDHGDGDGRGRRSAGRPGRADGVVGVGEQRDGGLGRARERRAADHGLRLPVPGEVDAGMDGGDEHDDHGVERDDHGARGGHGVRGAGAGDQRRGHERLVRLGQRLDGRERGAGVHLVGDVRRGGEPDRGGDGRGVGQRHGRQRDGLCDPGRRGQIKVLDRGRERGADVQVGAELRGRDGRRRQQHVRGGGAGDQRHGRAGEDGGPDDHGDGDGRGRRGAGRPGRADGVVGVGEQPDGGLGRARERRAADHGLRLPVPGEVDAGMDGGDEHDEHGVERDDHGARGGHGVRGAGAGDQRRGHERLVRPGQRLRRHHTGRHGVEDGADGDGGRHGRGQLHGGPRQPADGGCDGDGGRALGHGRDPGPDHPDLHRIELGHGPDGDGDGRRRCGHGERVGLADPQRGEYGQRVPGHHDHRRGGDGDGPCAGAGGGGRPGQRAAGGDLDGGGQRHGLHGAVEVGRPGLQHRRPAGPGHAGVDHELWGWGSRFPASPTARNTRCG